MPSVVEETPTARKKPTLFEKVLWWFGLKSVKILLKFVQLYQTKLRRRAVEEKPTYTKAYPIRPSLSNSFWIPKTYKPGGPLLPLLIDIHGGGFCIGEPWTDDFDNAAFCHKHGICVVSINYRKSPEYAFPTAVEDVAALIQAVLDDPELPIDKSKVAIVGYSAGGNLSLTGTQLNGLYDKIKGVVAFYPVTDMYRTLKMRVSSAIPPPNRDDILIKTSRAFNWAYLKSMDDYKNPLLSPMYAERGKLPKKLFILGCEYDILCAEAREAAEIYAAKESEAQQKIPLGDGRTGWSCGNVIWEELKGLEHGYNQRWEVESDAKIKAEWLKRTEEIRSRVAEWLFKEVYN